MPQNNVGIHLFCAECGEALFLRSLTTHIEQGIVLNVDPCAQCAEQEPEPEPLLGPTPYSDCIIAKVDLGGG